MTLGFNNELGFCLAKIVTLSLVPPRTTTTRAPQQIPPSVITTVLPNNEYRIRSLRTGQDLVVHYGRLKPETGDYNCTNVDLIPAGEILAAETTDITSSH